MATGVMGSGGSNLGMGVAFTLQDHFSQVAINIGNQMNRLEGKVDTMSDRINNAMGKIQSGFAMVAAGVGLLAPLGFGIKLASEFEATSVAFTTMLGSASKAADLMASIDKMAVKTPFEIDEVEKAYKQLLAFGIPVQDLEKDFTAIGNISAGLNADMGRLVKAFGQVKGKGLLKGGEFIQFAEAGVDLGEMLRNIGIDFDLSKMDVADHKITFDQVAAALEAAAGAGGRFDGMMDKLSQTMQGKMSNISDLVTRLFRRVGQTLELYVKPALNFILEMLGKVEAMAQTVAGQVVIAMASIGLAVIGVSVIFVGLKMILGAVLVEVAALLVAIWPFVAIAMAVGGAIVFVRTALSGLEEKMKGVDKHHDMMIKGTRNWVLEQRALGRSLKEVMGDVEKFGGEWTFMDKVGAIFKVIGQVFSSWSSERGTFMLPVELVKTLKSMGLWDLAQSIATWVVRIKTFFEGIWEGLKYGWQTILKPMLKWFYTVFSKVFKKVFASAGDALGKNTSELEKWKQAGKAVGIVIMLVLASLITSFILLGVVAFLALLPIVLVFGLIAAGIYGVYLLINSLIDVFKEKVMFFKDIGSMVIEYLKTGISEDWEAFTNWLGAMFDGLWETLGFDDANLNGNMTTTTVATGQTGIASPGKVAQYAERAAMQNTAKSALITQSQSNKQTTNVTVEMDSRKVGAILAEQEDKKFNANADQ